VGNDAKAAIDRSGIAPVTTREELIYLLSRAAEIEHGVSCLYLFAAHSLKSHLREGGMTPAQLKLVLEWKRRIALVSREEMLHLAQVANLLTAIGGAPHFKRTNFPMPADAFPFGVKLALEPFSLAVIERFVGYEMPEPGVLDAERQAEMDALAARIVARGDASQVARNGPPALLGLEPYDIDFSTIGEFYHKIETGFRTIPEEELFIGPADAQANARFLDFDGLLVSVTDRESACAAIEMIIEQGEAPTSAHPDAHFMVFDAIRREYEAAAHEAEARGAVFDPVRKVVSNPMTRFYEDSAGGTLITDPVTHEVADLFNVAYETMLLMLLRFFAHTEEKESELETLAGGTLRLMTSVLRPLGEALTKLPAGPEYPGLAAGPGFGYTREIQLLPHKRSAWVLFGERLHQIAKVGTELIGSNAGLPVEIEEAVAALQDLAERFAPQDRPWNAEAEEAEFRKLEAGMEVSLEPLTNGPYLATNVDDLTNSKGKRLRTHPAMALCRFGASANKPFCDGTHARVGFVSEKSPERTPDGVTDFVGAEITIHYNRLQCASAERCSGGLASVFRKGEEPWIQPDRATAREIMDVIARCPSGALRYTFKGQTGPAAYDQPSIGIIKDGPYEVRAIELRAEGWCEAAVRDRYTLCRCGASKNKPFCDGSHWAVGFSDPRN
jgi:CDGSH-type Zn-finger protein